MLQARREEELHYEPADAEKEEVAPFEEGGREPEADAWEKEEAEGGDNGAETGEVVDADERVRTLADPADCGVGACRAEDAGQGNADGG